MEKCKKCDNDVSDSIYVLCNRCLKKKLGEGECDERIKV